MSVMAEVVKARIDPRIKKEAGEIVERLGLSISDTIRMLFIQIVARKALPFQVEIPNAETIAAMEAADRGETEPVTLEQIAAEWRMNEKHPKNRQVQKGRKKGSGIRKI